MKCNEHSGHDHIHGSNCGHKQINHEGHIDYLHDSHMHHQHGNHVDEHVLETEGANKTTCTPEHTCNEHDNTHKHGSNCGHTAVPHGEHLDYLVNEHLHKPHGNHCDDHGTVKTSK